VNRVETNLETKKPVFVAIDFFGGLFSSTKRDFYLQSVAIGPEVSGWGAALRRKKASSG
jgi:hypothetical protein